MGKHGLPRSLRPEFHHDLSFGKKDHQIRWSKGLQGSDPFIGRRVPGGEDSWKHGYAPLNSSRVVYAGKTHMCLCNNVRSIVLMFGVVCFIFILDSVMMSISDSINISKRSSFNTSSGLKEDVTYQIDVDKSPVQMYERLVSLASRALAENEFKQETWNFWEEPYPKASAMWKPCADRKPSTRKPDKSEGYIMVSANGGLNQQRVAICNAVSVASLLNATLVLPRFLYSNVWKDPSQFGDIYQEEYFVNYLKDEINIVNELPPHLKSVDIKAIGSLITDADLVKEATPLDYIRNVLPLLHRNGVVHFLGFGNRLGFDPMPSNIQKLRCRCNFHALKFVPKIQQVGSLLVKRIRKHGASQSELDKELFGDFMPIHTSNNPDDARSTSRYLALHMRFEIDIVAYSGCDFGGGDYERKELQAYRENHFAVLLERFKNSKPISPAQLRKSGKCPLTPEEAALFLAGLGIKHGAYIYLAGSELYGGNSRMHALKDLYPNIVTKETLLTSSELAPFKNFSSQLAAVDFIASATSDVFAVTDSGSQLSSMVSGFRTYYGGGHAPTLQPNRKRLAAIFSEKSTIEWNRFEERVKKMIDESQRVRVRAPGRSIYQQPRCIDCMCKS